MRKALHEQGYYTLVTEASFVGMERTVEFRLLERGTMEPTDLPGTHPGVYREAGATGIVDESMANALADLRRDHRAKAHYQDGLAATERAETMYTLAQEAHAFAVGRSSQGHGRLCE